eukprot:g13148.t1
MKSPIPASRSSPGTGGSKSNPDAAKRIICDKLVQLGQNLRNPKAGQCIAVIHRQCEVLSHTMQNTTHVQSLWSDLRGYVRIGQLERAAQLADVILLSWRHLDPVSVPTTSAVTLVGSNVFEKPSSLLPSPLPDHRDSPYATRASKSLFEKVMSPKMHARLGPALLAEVRRTEDGKPRNQMDDGVQLSSHDVELQVDLEIAREHAVMNKITQDLVDHLDEGVVRGSMRTRDEYQQLLYREMDRAAAAAGPFAKQAEQEAAALGMALHADAVLREVRAEYDAKVAYGGTRW